MPHAAKTFAYKKLTHYPHMRPGDISIWNEYIDKNADNFLRCWYDVKVGKPEITTIISDEKLKRNWFDLSRWGIDVLAEDENLFYVIEVKPNANAKALGQACAYAKMWAKKRQPNKPVIPVVLTDTINPITAEAANFMGVLLWTP